MRAEVAATTRSGRRSLHPLIVMLWVLVTAAAVTHVIPAGKFQRHGGKVVPGSYHTLQKINGLPALLAPMPADSRSKPAQAAGVVALVSAVPAGMVKSASLIAMVLFVGGMFGVIRATGALEAAIDRLIHVTAGNVYVLSTVIMVAVALGSTFMGFISEFVVVIPMIGLIGDRLGLPKLFAVAVVGVAAKIGYAASVTNPVALALAQPIAGVPLFSGSAARLAIFVVLLAIGIAYVMLYLRRLPKRPHTPEPAAMTGRRNLVLLCLLLGGAGMLIGARLWDWSSTQLASVYISLSVLMSIVGGLSADEAADAFLEGMRSMLLAALLIGLASAVEIVLQGSQVLDSIVAGATAMLAAQSEAVVASGLMVSEMVLDVAIPSVSGKAAVSMPILVPIAHLSGVSAQVTITAFLLGGGLTNMVTPTSGMLLAFVSASRVGFGEWIRFVAPLFAILCVVSVLALWTMVAIGP